MYFQKEKNRNIIVSNKKGIISSDKEKINVITEHFQNCFNVENPTEFPEIKPEKLIPPFSTEEVQKAIKSLKKINHKELTILTVK